MVLLQSAYRVSLVCSHKRGAGSHINLKCDTSQKKKLQKILEVITSITHEKRPEWSVSVDGLGYVLLAMTTN